MAWRKHDHLMLMDKNKAKSKYEIFKLAFIYKKKKKNKQTSYAKTTF